MTDTNQLPPLPEPEGVIVVGTQALRGFTADQMRAYALQARAQVQGDPSWWMRETDEGAEWTDTAPLVLSGWTQLYTTPQPAQATQAEAQQPDNTACKSVQKRLEAQQPATSEPVAWNSIQIASWIGSQLMHEPSMFERATVCKFVRSLGRHPTLLKHSPKLHPAPSEPGDVMRDAERYRWLRDNGVLGFSGAPSWRVSVSFDAMDAYAQTLDSNIDAAIDAAKDTK